MNKYTFEELEEGQSESFKAEVTEDLMEKFLAITGDNNDLHVYDEYAKSQGFSQKVVYGLLVQSFLSTLVGVHLPGKYALFLAVDSSFKKPTYVGDSLEVKGTIQKKLGFGNIIEIKAEITNQKKEVVVTSNLKVKVVR